jgi:hypothetical protein
MRARLEVPERLAFLARAHEIDAILVTELSRCERVLIEDQGQVRPGSG